MKKIIGVMVLALVLSTQVMADTKTTCTAQYGEGYSWVVVNVVEKEVCLRCIEGYPQVLINAQISVPKGPRGTYITQNYFLTSTHHNRLNEGHFKKVGVPAGPTSEKWVDWFPQEIVILGDTSKPLYIHFNGESLELDCK